MDEEWLERIRAAVAEARRTNVSLLAPTQQRNIVWDVETLLAELSRLRAHGQASEQEIQAARAYFDHIAVLPPLGEAFTPFYERSRALHAAYDAARATNEHAKEGKQ